MKLLDMPVVTAANTRSTLAASVAREPDKNYEHIIAMHAWVVGQGFSCCWPAMYSVNIYHQVSLI